MDQPSAPADDRDLRLQLAELFAHERDADEVLRRVAELVGRHLRVSRVGYGEVNQGDNTLHIPIDWTDGMPSMVGRHPLLDGMLVRAYLEGRTVAIEDTEHWTDSAEVRASLAAGQIRACLVAPLTVNGELVAMFAANHHEPRAWTADEIALVTDIGAQVWRVLAQLRLTVELRESEEQFRTIAESMPAICWLADAEGRTYWGNRRFESFFGSIPGGALQLAQVIHPDDVARAAAGWGCALATGEPLETPVSARGAEGVYRPFLSSATPIRDASGAVARWCGVMVDLSDEHARLRREALLRSFSDRTRTMSDPREILATLAGMLGQHLGISHMRYGEQDGPDPRVFNVFAMTPGSAMAVPDARHVFTADYDDIFVLFEQGQTVVVSDSVEPAPGSNDAVRAQADSEGTRSGVSVPIVKGGRLVAMLSALHRAPRQYSADEIALCEEIAERLWESVSRGRAEQALQERERNQAFLVDWSDTVRQATDADMILQLTLEKLGRHLDSSRVNYSEAIGGGDVFTIRREWLNGACSIVGGEYRLDQIGAEIERAFCAGETVVSENTLDDPRSDEVARAVYRATDAIALISVPLVRAGRVVAVLGVQQKEPRRWRAGEVQLSVDLADRTWAVLERARAEKALQERERNQAFLIDWSDAVRRAEDPDRIMTITLERLGVHLGATGANFSQVEDDGQQYRITHEWVTEGVPVLGGRYPLDAFGEPIHRQFLAGEVVRSDNVADDPRVGDAMRALCEDCRALSFVSAPLIRHGRVATVLSVQQSRPRRWAPGEVTLLCDVAERTWDILERARAEEALRERERNQAFLIEWSDSVRGETTPRRILALTLDKLGRHLGVNRCNYAEGEYGPALVVLQEWQEGAVTVAGQRFPLGVFGERVVAAHLSGEPVVVNDIACDPLIDDGNRDLYQSVAVGAFLTVPLVRGDRLEAVLSVQQTGPRIWQLGEISLVREVADRTWAVLERARSEERLAENEALLAAFMENAPLGMHLKDAEGRYIRINPELASAMGTPIEAVIGRHPAELFPAEMCRVIEEIENEARAGRRASAEFHGRDTERYRSALSMVFPIPGGHSARTAGFTIDLTERERAEAALQKSRDALYQSEKLSALGSMLAGVSHELNNPLSIVVAQSVMLERQTKGTEVAERAMKVRRAADRCARIVQTFLAMARQKRPHREAVSINTVVAAALELADYGLRTDGIEVVKRLAPDLPAIPADADQLHQIIINLVINAQQAIADAGGEERRLTVSTGLGPEPRTLVVDVSDTGPGIPEDAQRRIFEPFYTTKPQGLGTGVGLSFSQGLAEAHGGQLALMPSAVGACFRLTLPIDAVELPLDVPAEAAAVPPLPARRALVVDDEPEIAEALADFLSLEGFTCQVAVGGAAAKVRLGEGEWDLVVSDLRMPGVDGPALYGWIKAARPDLAGRTAFTTGDTLGAAAAAFLAEAKRPLLEKPFMPDAVHRLLQQMALT